MNTSADLRCLTCGTDNNVRECPDWCPAMQGACDCGKSLCGDCMRRPYYKGATR